MSNDNEDTGQHARQRRLALGTLLEWRHFDFAITFDTIFRGAICDLIESDVDHIEVLEGARRVTKLDITFDAFTAWAAGRKDMHYSNRVAFFKTVVLPAIKAAARKDAGI